MGVKPLIRLAKLDIRLLLNMGSWALRTFGVIYSLPLLLTMVLFVIIATISNVSRIFILRDHNSNLKPWMVKYQFIFAYSKKSENKC